MVLYNKAEYIETDTGNKVNRKCTIQGSQNIVLGISGLVKRRYRVSEHLCIRVLYAGGKTILESGVILRGDLRRAGTGAAVVLALGKYCRLGANCIIRPPYKTYKGVFSYYPMKISDYVTIGENTIVEAASIGSMVQIGKNCIIGRFAIIKDCAVIEDDTVIAPGTVVPSMTRFSGSPGRLTGDIPESSPELFEAEARTYYAEFKAAP